MGQISWVLILIIADHILNELQFCSNKHVFLYRFIGKPYILLLTFLINLSEICIIFSEIFWIKFKLL